MALTVDDLLHPRGRLNADALWPRSDGETTADRDSRVEDIVGAYITEAYVKAAGLTAGTDQDDAARLWVYYRAWDEVYQRLLMMPSTVSTEEGSSAYLLTQMEHVGEMAAAALAEFEALLETAGIEEAESYGTIQSYR